MQQALHVVEGERPPTLPILATAGDAREVVQFLKKKPDGITVVEASDGVRRRLFDPRKVAAYEAWGIVAKSGDRIKLSRLGHEFALKLEPEAQIYRAMLDNTQPYRGLLTWIHEQELDLVTYVDIVEYWRDHIPETIHRGAKELEGHVVSFFQLCHAAEIGIATLGRKGQPSRLRVDHDQLATYVASVPALVSETIFTEQDEMAARPTPHNGGSRKRLRVFISIADETEVARSVQDALQIMEFDTEVVQREIREAKLVPDRTFEAMRRCDAGIIVVSHADCHADAQGRVVLNQSTLIEIGAASVHFARRLVLLSFNQVPALFNTNDYRQFEFGESSLTWETGLRLIKVIKLFENELSANRPQAD